MRHIPLAFFATVTALAMASCSSEPAEPVEQIIVREPGAAVQTTAIAGGADIVTIGKAAFSSCIACHSVSSEGSSGAGPNLYGVVGRTAGMLDNYSYSEALTASQIVWNNAQLDAFLANPSAVVPGTTMSAGSVEDEERRAAIIAYLASLSG